MRSYNDVIVRDTVLDTLEEIAREKNSLEWQRSRKLYGDGFRARIIGGSKMIINPTGFKYDLLKDTDIVSPIIDKSGDLNISDVYDHLVTLCNR